MVWSENNWIADIVEINLNKTQCQFSGNNTVPLNVDFRASTFEYTLDEFTVEIGFKRVWIHLQCDGVEIVSGARFGEPLKNIGELVREDTEKTTNKSAMASVKSDLSVSSKTGVGAGISAAGEGKIQKSVSRRETTSNERVKTGVVAKPNGKWMVDEGNNEPLVGTYLMGDTICSVKPKKDSNRHYYKLVLTTTKKDLWYKVLDSPKKSFLKMNLASNPNRERIFKLLLSGISEFDNTKLEEATKSKLLRVSEIYQESD